ncbi:hypothetical protein ABIE52_000576 [Rhodococcus sp. OAS809]|jgi:hypothetical protein|uniref:hypothetical protein n=1 Tax=Rhodococcus TaxID=1827 RepID=UPI00178A78BB
MFPHLPDRATASDSWWHELSVNMIRVLAQLSLSWWNDQWITNDTPVPCAMSWGTLERMSRATMKLQIWSARRGRDAGHVGVGESEDRWT